jgi:hypothetical protein
MSDPNKALREHVVNLLRDGGAHISFDDFIAGFPPELCGRRVDHVPYTPWQVLEHMRIAQWDILEFSRNPKHISPEFPKGYWPPSDTPGNADLWKESAEKFRHDLEQMQSLVADPAVDLFAKIPHGDGQTLLREAMLVADHNAYHLGVLAVMGRLLKAEP